MKGQPEAGVAEHVNKFLEARPYLRASSGQARPAAPPAPGTTGFLTGVPVPTAPTHTHTAEELTTMARAMTYRPGETPRPSRGSR